MTFITDSDDGGEDDDDEDDDNYDGGDSGGSGFYDIDKIGAISSLIENGKYVTTSLVKSTSIEAGRYIDNSDCAQHFGERLSVRN